jgi:hypothetical protein
MDVVLVFFFPFGCFLRLFSTAWVASPLWGGILRWCSGGAASCARFTAKGRKKERKRANEQQIAENMISLSSVFSLRCVGAVEKRQDVFNVVRIRWCEIMCFVFLCVRACSISLPLPLSPRILFVAGLDFCIHKHMQTLITANEKET